MQDSSSTHSQGCYCLFILSWTHSGLRTLQNTSKMGQDPFFHDPYQEHYRHLLPFVQGTLRLLPGDTPSPVLDPPDQTGSPVRHRWSRRGTQRSPTGSKGPTPVDHGDTATRRGSDSIQSELYMLEGSFRPNRTEAEDPFGPRCFEVHIPREVERPELGRWSVVHMGWATKGCSTSLGWLFTW